MKNKNILLLNVSADAPYSYFSKIPPLGLICLASYIKSKNKDVKINVVDTEVEYFSEDQLKQYDLLGVTLTAFNRTNTYKLIEKAKEKGLITVVGGPFATTLGEQILTNINSLDYIITGAGEESLLQLINGTDPKQVPNLLYKEGKEVKRSSTIYLMDLKNAIIDYSLIDIKKYNTIPVLSHKGCGWRQHASKPCSFCSLQDSYQERKVEDFWKDVVFLVNQNINNGNPKKIELRDVGDALFANEEFLKKLVDAKPSDIEEKYSLMAYGRAPDLLKNGSYAHRLGIENIFVGFESGDNEILYKMHKGATVEIYKRMLDQMKKENIKLTASFILGLEGENKNTVRNTTDFIKCLVKNYKGVLSALGVNIVYPFPGSQIYNDLKSKIPEEFEQAKSQDKFPSLKLLQKKYIENFTSVSFNYLKKAKKKIKEIIEDNGINYFDMGD